MCARRFASTKPEKASTTPSSTPDELADLDQASSFATPSPSKDAVDAFDTATRVRARESQLPGNRYQYHPPKYYRGPLHPIQMPPSSDPTARDFVPGPFSVPRIKHTFDTTIAPDLLTLTYTHKPPGFVPPESNKGELREWDGSSPYHKNRPRRGPRGGGSSRLGLVERDIAFNNIPDIKAVTIYSTTPKAVDNKEYLHIGRAVLQAITGSFAEPTKMKKSVAQWGMREGAKAGAKTSLHGDAAHEFVDKLITLVLPKIKDWPGINATTGDGSGNIALGLKPEWMAFFPEMEYNYSMYPPKMVPGCHIFIETTGTSDRQGRLLLEALGLPFYGKATH